MPFFKFHFVEASRMAGVSRRMADRLQETIGCPREQSHTNHTDRFRPFSGTVRPLCLRAVPS